MAKKFRVKKTGKILRKKSKMPDGFRLKRNAPYKKTNPRAILALKRAIKRLS